MEQLNLVQFHWWDYEIDRQVEVASWLAELRQEGKIANIGGTNFNTEQMLRIINAGVPLVSMQVQYSLIDDRPSRSMVEAAQAHGVNLLCYGSVGGGLFSERMLGVPELQSPFENRSLIKYKLIVDEFGGWDLFQELLEVLSAIAAHHDSDIASIASRAVLERPGVAAVIVGARNRNHLARNLAIPGIELTAQDFAAIDACNGCGSVGGAAGVCVRHDDDRARCHHHRHGGDCRHDQSGARQAPGGFRDQSALDRST